MVSSAPFGWYAVQTRSQYEKSVRDGLASRGYESFLPVYPSRRKWSDRFQNVELPLFPGYVFCRLDIRTRLPVLTMPGVIRFVGIAKTPIAIEDQEIGAIQAVIGSHLLVRPWPFLKVGQTVSIEEGPLQNVTGILEEIDGASQLVVSISLLQRSVAVAIPREWVRPKESALVTTQNRCTA